MKKRILAWGFALAMLGGSLSVQAQEVIKDTTKVEGVANTGDEQLHKTEAVEVTFKNLEGKIDDSKNSKLLVRIKGNIPVLNKVSKDGAVDKVNAYYTKRAEQFNEDKETTYKIAKQVYEDEIEKCYGAVPHSWQGYKLGMKYTLAYQDEKVMSFVEEDTKSEGDDVTKLTRKTQNFDMTTGEIVEFSDLVTNEAKAKQYIHDYIVDEIKNAIDSKIDYLYYGYKNHVDEMLEGSSWRFTNNGIVIIANEYSFTPEATGYKEFMIPYSKIPYLKDAYKK